MTLPANLPSRLTHFLNSLPTMEHYSDRGNHSATFVWNNLNHLEDHNKQVILEPIASDLYINTFPIRSASSFSSSFPTQNAVDSGTLYLPFTNGMSLAYSRAVMATEPSDRNLHSSDTITMCYHSPDPLAPDLSRDQSDVGESLGNSIIMATIPDLPEEEALYETALYLSEGNHALKLANHVKDILVLDGPIFPVGLLAWYQGKPNLKNLLSMDGPSRRALKAYIDLIDFFVNSAINTESESPPLIGFVKNPRGTTIKSTFDHSSNQTESFIWPHDSSFFKYILRSHLLSTGSENLTTNDANLAYTNWFISKSRIALQFEDFLTDMDLGITNPKNPLYDLTFFMIYDPRSDLIYRVESPYVFTQSPNMRKKIENYVLKEMAIYNGPPRVINKADHLAHMSNSEKENIGNLLASSFHTRIDINYNSLRWHSMDQLRNL